MRNRKIMREKRRGARTQTSEERKRAESEGKKITKRDREIRKGKKSTMKEVEVKDNVMMSEMRRKSTGR